MIQLKIGDSVLGISEERKNFAMLRTRYEMIGHKHRAAFHERTNNFRTAGDLDNIFGELPGYVDAVIDDVVENVAKDLVDNRIYDVAAAAIRSALEEVSEDLPGEFNYVLEQYSEIIGNAAELDAQRQFRRESRGQVGWFAFGGLTNAAKGMAQAAVANTAIGAAHGVTNFLAKAVSNHGDKEKKRNLLADPLTKVAIGNFLHHLAMQGAELVATITEDGFYAVVSEEDKGKAMAIIENVLAARVPNDLVSQVVIQALTLDPFLDEAWIFWIDHFGDVDGSVGMGAQALGIRCVYAHKKKLIADRKATMSWDTPEDCHANATILEGVAKNLAIPFESEKMEIESRASRLDQERRTVNGVEYPSLSDAKAAKIALEAERQAALEALQVEKIDRENRTVNGVEHATLADANAARETLEAEQMAQQDLILRTFEGVVYETRQGAEEARAAFDLNRASASRADSIIGWILLAYRRCLEIKGRSCRKEFWIFTAFNVIFQSIILVLFSMNMDDNHGDPKTWLIVVILLIWIFSGLCILTLQVRRFHDQDRSGWLVLINLIPYIGWIIVLVVMAIGGVVGANRFGPDPRPVS